MRKEKLKLKKGVKTTLIILFIYLLVACYLLFAANRIDKIENNSEAYSTRSIQINFNK